MAAAVDRDDMLRRAKSRQQTPFDYVIVGSGAGGGPLACRLAEAGKTVLVLEAGPDPAQPHGQDPLTPDNLREVHQVPGYHARATEDPEMSWLFSVRHYQNDARQKLDSKYDPTHDASVKNPAAPKGGIQYPRASALGGCTAHNAMIIVRPNDADWDGMAALVDDDSWRASNMQGYFSRLERCRYFKMYQGFFERKLRWLYVVWKALLRLINPRLVLDREGHGFCGWQPVSFSNPELFVSLTEEDPLFSRIVKHIVRALLKGKSSFLEQALLTLRIVQYLDPNDARRREENPEGLALIPIGTDGLRRAGVREYLLDTQKNKGDKLVISTGVFVKRVVFEPGPAGEPPRAVGVEVVEGPALYGALGTQLPPTSAPFSYFARREVILCAGAFNTPQLLMLSGIGNSADLAAQGIPGLCDAGGVSIAPVVHRPGVGSNLQDRYELSVINQVSNPFAMLRGVWFKPGGGKNDPEHTKWAREAVARANRQGDNDCAYNPDNGGLYTTNGCVVGMMWKSGRTRGQEAPDLFVFGFPAAFRGYYWGWSEQLFRATRQSPADQQDLWTWVILKAYTSNSGPGGYVRLASNNAFDPPEINFRSFSKGVWDDLPALEEGVRRVRELTKSPDFIAEIQPGAQYQDEQLRRWIIQEVWGHHACGTCRIGRPDDNDAVLDSKFRVIGVSGLRVVDASIFPKIPAYFIVTPTFMISEKAADTLLEASPDYPLALKAAEVEALRKRREIAGLPTPPAGAFPELPADTVGLALSGGGIRSATFSLGVLQGLAARSKLKKIDMMSTVSGGGYIGAFLGALYTRKRASTNSFGNVERDLTKSTSESLWWLRDNANYIGGDGFHDVRRNLGAYWRGLSAVYLRLGILFLTLLTAVGWVGRWDLFAEARVRLDQGLVLSPWWTLSLAIVALALAPAYIGFWLTQRGAAGARYPFFSLLAWIVLLLGAIDLLRISVVVGAALIGVLLLGWLWQEGAGVGLAHDVNRSAVVRDRLTRALGGSILLLGASVVWFLIDTAAAYAAKPQHDLIGTVGSLGAAGAAILPLLRWGALKLFDLFFDPKEKRAPLPAKLLAALVAVPALLFLVFALDLFAHRLLDYDEARGRGWVLFVVAFGAVFSLAVGRAYDFLNRSSLQAPYSDKLVRTFLGASNPRRIGRDPTRLAPDVYLADPCDDIPFDEYHPELSGGPLHFLNVCVNETVHAASGRHLREDKGLPMCVGPCGVSVGQRFHALWQNTDADKKRPLERFMAWIETRSLRSSHVGLRALPAGPDPNAFHVLASRKSPVVRAEPLTLGQWMSISAGALSPGSGRETSLVISLLYGLLNLRLGYWWDSRIWLSERPGRYPPPGWQKLKSLFAAAFRVQAMILQEWRAYFPGPSERLWYLTDGGHYDNSGLYELLRRKVPLIIAVDATEDERSEMESLALITRQARLDFCAKIDWIEPLPGRRHPGWVAFPAGIPAEVQAWIDPDALGALDEIKGAGGRCAALARVTYDNSTAVSWIVLVKAALTGNMALDVQSYAQRHPDFPNEQTADQFFDANQWESYRWLGEHIAKRVFL